MTRLYFVYNHVIRILNSMRSSFSYLSFEQFFSLILARTNGANRVTANILLRNK